MYTTLLTPIQDSVCKCFEVIKGWFSNYTFSRSYGHHGHTWKNKDTVLEHMSVMKQFPAYYNIKHSTVISHNPTVQIIYINIIWI